MSKNKPIKKSNDGPTPPVHGNGVRFDMEEDAENLFKQAMDDLENGRVAAPNKDGHEDAQSKNSRPSRPPPQKIDLHGMTVQQARGHVDARINEIISGLVTGSSGGATVTVVIVTGKGLHSGAGGGILARDIPEWVRNRFARQIVAMDESPADVQLGGIPVRGFFRVTLRARN